jgi:hypothetical protein
MQKIALNVKEELFASLERDYKTFVRLSTKLDNQFTTPSFDNFLLARLSDNATPLTEDAVQHVMLSGQYAWAKRALDKDFPDVVGILINQAAEHGFSFASRQEWTTDDMTKAARAWSTAIVKNAKGDEAQIDVLATQIKNAVESILVIEEKLKTPAWRLSQSLLQQLNDVKIAIEHATGAMAREKLGELRVLLKMGMVYGAVTKKQEQELMESLQSRKPFLFQEEAATGFDRFFIWLRNTLA